ncbi:response regulator transcription factor [Acanthopleuribacter pedis]|uniref:Response regulator transcription factor n=1 Tax=Acanthopleuribacter pedis TaxID=442870 RepID=A0A8J7U2Z4_9BACT|nr:response regulator transcription factor [Acanthopleuribacter pedis]MBO1319833.1 response regulator transcription factor [Acanthopleuribacter pedis]
MRVLVIEDNADIAANIHEYLSAEGFTVDHALDGVGGLHLALTQPFDVLVLDLMLPGMDGLALCRNLREQGLAIPILMLTARDTLDDKLVGFEAGTDDYLVKPFAMQELVARLRALLLRRHRRDGMELTVGDLTLHKGTFEVRRQGRLLELNKVCIRILRYLMENTPNVVTREDLAHYIWDDQPPGSDALRSHIYHLRQVVDKPFNLAMIQTIRGVGFRILADASERGPRER